METYIGTKIIKAEPMDSIRYEMFKKNISEAEAYEINNQNIVEGYKIVYEDGYTSWSPKEVFERTYIKMPTTLTDHVSKLLFLGHNRLNHTIWEAVRMGISYQAGLPKPTIQSAIAELKSIAPIHHYVITTEKNDRYFIDLEIEAADNAQSIMDRLCRQVGDFQVAAGKKRDAKFQFQKL